MTQIPLNHKKEMWLRGANNKDLRRRVTAVPFGLIFTQCSDGLDENNYALRYRIELVPLMERSD